MRHGLRHACYILPRSAQSATRPRWTRLESIRRASPEEKPIRPSTNDLGRMIKDDFAKFQEKYESPKHPIVLAHGLMGFDELRLAGKYLPGVQYWRGMKEALTAHNIEVITTSVPTTGSIAVRAKVLADEITNRAAGRDVNIVAHSMGGLDSRYMISQLKPKEFRVRSLTTIATPHRGSSAADMILRDLGEIVPGIYKLLARLKIDTGAFSQLTRKYVQEEFNPANPDDDSVRYFSYGASAKPSLVSVFRLSHDLIDVLEGANDGLVSVSSSKWGGGNGYKGTLVDVTHLELINWTNRLKLLVGELTFHKRRFVAAAFYLHIADMLAREGL